MSSGIRFDTMGVDGFERGGLLVVSGNSELDCESGGLYCRLTSDNELRLKELSRNLSDLNYLGITAVPFERILEVVNFLPYGHCVRVAFMFLFLTGCRLSELDRMAYQAADSFIKGSYVFWRVGKNQRGQWRKEFLPEWYLRELLYYRQTHKVPDGRLFGFGWTTLRRYFNRDVRPHLSQAWNTKTLTPARNKIVNNHLLLKGLRKSFATLVFAGELRRRNNDTSAALVFVSKRMCHSSVDITVHHYLNEFEPLNMAEWSGYSPVEILSLAVQKHLPEYDSNIDWGRVRDENQQSRITEYYL